MTRPTILTVDPDRRDQEVLAKTAALLHRGALVVIPTDTVYGLAVHPDTPDGLARVYQAKGRADEKPIVLLISDVAQLTQRGGCLSACAARLADAFWPGAVTLVVSTPSGTQGFRVPNCPATLELIARCGGALYVTSANRSGDEPTCRAVDAATALGDAVDLVLDAGTTRGAASAVVRVHDESIEVLRAGPHATAELERVACANA